MKKLVYALAVVLALGTVSCSDDGASENKQADSKVLTFDSGKQMQDMIDNIENLKSQKESRILEMLIKKNNLHAPVAGQTGIAAGQDSFNQAAALQENVQFYHSERLKAIRELRQELHFTSIQSIADEINSLKVLDPAAAEQLYNDYKTYLEQTEYMTTTIFGGLSGNIIGIDGKVVIGGASLDFANPDVAARWIRDEDIKQGALASSSSYMIVWSAGRSVHKDDIGQTFYRSWTQLVSVVWYNSTWTLYPSYFFTNSGSQGYFFQGLSTWIVAFPAGANSVLRNESGQQNGAYGTGNGNVSGTYMAPVGNTYWTLTGSVVYN